MRAMTINSWLYCNKTWLNALNVKTGAHAGPLHQGPRKASYAPVINPFQFCWVAFKIDLHVSFHEIENCGEQSK